MKLGWIWGFLIIIGLANSAINANWFAGYLMGLMKFAVTFTPTPTYTDPAPRPLPTQSPEVYLLPGSTGAKTVPAERR